MSRTKSKPNPHSPDHGPGLIPPDEIFGRVLPQGPIIPDADLPFEERVERAVRRFMAGFHEHEHDRLREVFVLTFCVNSQQPSLISAAAAPEHQIT